MALGPLSVSPRNPDEPFRSGENPIGVRIVDLWRWCFSDLVENTSRGLVAEFLVAAALEVANGVKPIWQTWDLDFEGHRIEVKSSAYLQTWFQPKLTAPSFSIAPTVAWDAATNTWGTEKRRHSNIYVFALLAHKDKGTVDPLNVQQWEFTVVPTSGLDRAFGKQKKLSLNSLRKLVPAPCNWFDLRRVVETAISEISQVQRP